MDILHDHVNHQHDSRRTENGSRAPCTPEEDVISCTPHTEWPPRAIAGEDKSMPVCVFCDVVNGSAISYGVFRSSTHMAFLDRYPSVRGQTLVIPINHLPSDVLALPEAEYLALMSAGRQVAMELIRKLGALRMCLVTEGMEVQHAHVKLYPIYTIGASVSEDEEDLSVYNGYLSTKHGRRATDTDLLAVSEFVTGR